MKVLVALKRVPDPENTARLRVGADRTTIESSSLAWKTNPFDELALETALRLTEDGRAPRNRLGDILAVTLGPPDADSTLRGALALGASRALRIEADDSGLDGLVVARALAAVVRTEAPDLVILGKQTVDGDSGQVGPQLAELLDWPCVAACSRVTMRDGTLNARRELDGGAIDFEVELPAVLTVDLRIAAGDSVYSAHTPRDHTYPDGLRFAPLPAIIKAKNKPLQVRSLQELAEAASCHLAFVEFELPPRRGTCSFASTPERLVEKLALVFGELG